MQPGGFPGRLSRLQSELLQAFPDYGVGFFLTGGGALAGFYGSQRPTRDLDLFTRDSELFDFSDEVVAYIARASECTVERLRTFPHFRRYRLSRGTEQTVLDLVKEEVAAVFEPVVPAGFTVAVDQAEEIAINKVCALVSRGEPRDLADLAFLQSMAVSLDQALALSSRKDGGIGPDTLLVALLGLPEQTPGDGSLGEFRLAWIRKLQLELLPPRI